MDASSDPTRWEALLEEAAFRCEHVEHQRLPRSWGEVLEVARVDKVYAVTGGRGWLSLDGEVWDLRPGRVFLIPAGTVQKGGADARMGIEILWAHFTASTAATMHLLRVVRFPRCLSGASAKTVRRRMTRLLGEWRGRRPGRQLALKTLLPGILLEAWRSPLRDRVAPARREPGAGARSAGGGRVGQVSAAVERIIQGCGGPLRLADLAAAAGLSPAHFSEVFTRLIGMPPMRFLRRHRVRRAQSLLRLTDRRISDIAAAVGYPDPYHFSRAFRAETGESPSAYRSEPGA